MNPEAVCVIEMVEAVKQRYRIEYIVNMLIGRATDEIKNNSHDQLECFGSLCDVEERIVVSLVRQVIIAGYLQKDLDNYGVLKVTSQGKAFLKSPKTFMMVEDVDYSESYSEPQGDIVSSALDPQLFSILKSLRKDIARRQNVPPYLIFFDTSLEAMATLYPISNEEMLTIPGVGSGKASRYGAEFVKVIKTYVEENEIVRPEDFRVKSKGSKSNRKITIIQQIDRKIDLEEICDSLDLDFSEFVDELEAIVESGTKINIDYYLNEILDEDQIDEIFDYFRDSEDGDVESAIQELGSEYDDDDIRLVRVKFISDMGN